jgi:hypothetical protein
MMRDEVRHFVLCATKIEQQKRRHPEMVSGRVKGLFCDSVTQGIQRMRTARVHESGRAAQRWLGSTRSEWETHSALCQTDD